MVFYTILNSRLNTQHLNNTQNECHVLYISIVIGRQQQHYEGKVEIAQNRWASVHLPTCTKTCAHTATYSIIVEPCKWNVILCACEFAQ